jgi:hypothetical protein
VSGSDLFAHVLRAPKYRSWWAYTIQAMFFPLPLSISTRFIRIQDCAYIRMDLLSKEIAPLFNISICGVEISSYRLRKKMGIDIKVYLSEFLYKL